VRSSTGGHSIVRSIVFIGRSNRDNRAYALDRVLDNRIERSNRVFENLFDLLQKERGEKMRRYKRLIKIWKNFTIDI
jgi:hypothetical protein